MYKKIILVTVLLMLLLGPQTTIAKRAAPGNSKDRQQGLIELQNKMGRSPFNSPEHQQQGAVRTTNNEKDAEGNPLPAIRRAPTWDELQQAYTEALIRVILLEGAMNQFLLQQQEREDIIHVEKLKAASKARKAVEEKNKVDTDPENLGPSK